MLQNPHSATNESTIPLSQDYRTTGVPVHGPPQLQPSRNQVGLSNTLSDAG